MPIIWEAFPPGYVPTPSAAERFGGPMVGVKLDRLPTEGLQGRWNPSGVPPVNTRDFPPGKQAPDKVDEEQ